MSGKQLRTANERLGQRVRRPRERARQRDERAHHRRIERDEREAVRRRVAPQQRRERPPRRGKLGRDGRGADGRRGGAGVDAGRREHRRGGGLAVVGRDAREHARVVRLLHEEEQRQGDQRAERADRRKRGAPAEGLRERAAGERAEERADDCFRLGGGGGLDGCVFCMYMCPQGKRYGTRAKQVQTP